MRISVVEGLESLEGLRAGTLRVVVVGPQSLRGGSLGAERPSPGSLRVGRGNSETLEGASLRARTEDHESLRLRGARSESLSPRPLGSETWGPMRLRDVEEILGKLDARLQRLGELKPGTAVRVRSWIERYDEVEGVLVVRVGKTPLAPDAVEVKVRADRRLSGRLSLRGLSYRLAGTIQMVFVGERIMGLVELTPPVMAPRTVWLPTDLLEVDSDEDTPGTRGPGNGSGPAPVPATASETGEEGDEAQAQLALAAGRLNAIQTQIEALKDKHDRELAAERRARRVVDARLRAAREALAREREQFELRTARPGRWMGLVIGELKETAARAEREAQSWRSKAEAAAKQVRRLEHEALVRDWAGQVGRRIGEQVAKIEKEAADAAKGRTENDPGTGRHP